MNKHAFLALTAGAAGAVIAAQTGLQAQETPTIRIGTLISDSSAEPLCGVDTGMFAQAGSKVDVQPFTNYDALQGALRVARWREERSTWAFLTRSRPRWAHPALFHLPSSRRVDPVGKKLDDATSSAT